MTTQQKLDFYRQWHAFAADHADLCDRLYREESDPVLSHEWRVNAAYFRRAANRWKQRSLTLMAQPSDLPHAA